MLWSVAAPFFAPDRPGQVPANRWIDDFVRSERHKFIKIPRPHATSGSWHQRARRATSLGGWARYWEQARSAVEIEPDGIITVFPQLAAAAGLQKRFHRSSRPLVAWCFNIGARPPQPILAAARAALKRVDRFVVHSRAEVPVISEWFGISPDNVRFVPLQRAPLPALSEEAVEAPFLVALGSANRDYRSLFRALEQTALPAVVVAAPRAIADLSPPANVTIRSGLSRDECMLLAQQARFSVVSLQDVPTAAGQVTVVEGMRMGRATIATRGVGTVDYIADGETGLLVEPEDVEGLARAMRRLWEDGKLRERLSRNASAYAEQQFSDEAAGAALKMLLDELA